MILFSHLIRIQVSEGFVNLSCSSNMTPDLSAASGYQLLLWEENSLKIKMETSFVNIVKLVDTFFLNTG